MEVYPVGTLDFGWMGILFHFFVLERLNPFVSYLLIRVQDVSVYTCWSLDHPHFFSQAWGQLELRLDKG